MMTINLRDFFYWYKVDEFIKVTDEVAQELRVGKVEDVTHWRRLKRNKANYSLDAGDGIEYEPSPEEFMARAVTIQRLCCALNYLPSAQGRRIDACYLLGQSMTEIAQAEGLDESFIRESIRHGLEQMRKIFLKSFIPPNWPSSFPEYIGRILYLYSRRTQLRSGGCAANTKEAVL